VYDRERDSERKRERKRQKEVAFGASVTCLAQWGPAGLARVGPVWRTGPETCLACMGPVWRTRDPFGGVCDECVRPVLADGGRPT